jgi:lambda family phage portal protein
MFPHWALRREVARARMLALNETNQRYYDAGHLSSYRRPAGADVSPQAATMDAGETIRQYARNLDENSDIAIGILDGLVNSIVGTGLPIQPLLKSRDGSLNEAANLQMARILADWSKKPTADRQSSFGQAQRLLCRTWLRDGESFTNMLVGNMGGFKHAGVVPFSIELMEPDYVPYLLNESKPRLIVQGVEMTPYYAPLAYYVAKDHPGDVWNTAAMVFTNESSFRRVDAERILHLKFIRRINQVRGVSLLHGAMRGIEDIKDYSESERIAARVSAAFTAFIKKSPDTVTNINQDTGNRDLEMAPGMIFDNLLPGEEIGTIDSMRPNTAVNEFTNGQLKRVAAGTMSSYSTIARDYEGSYSSQRQAMVEAKPNYDILREYFVNTLVRPIYEQLVDMAVTSGALRTRGVDPESLHDVSIASVALPWVDPKKEVEADVMRIDNGLASRSQVISERGGDPLHVARQREQDQKLFEFEKEGETNELDSETDQSSGAGQDAPAESAGDADAEATA